MTDYNRFRWLVPGVIAGAPHPDLDGGLREVADFLREAGVRTIVTVDERPITPDPAELGFGYLFVETANYRPTADLGRLVSAIDHEIESGRPVLVHCFAGIGRTGTVLAAWLLWNDGGLTAQQAIDRVIDEYLPDYAHNRFPEQQLDQLFVSLRGKQRAQAVRRALEEAAQRGIGTPGESAGLEQYAHECFLAEYGGAVFQRSYKAFDGAH